MLYLIPMCFAMVVYISITGIILFFKPGHVPKFFAEIHKIRKSKESGYYAADAKYLAKVLNGYRDNIFQSFFWPITFPTWAHKNFREDYRFYQKIMKESKET